MGHILRRNCLLQRVIEGKIQGGIEVTGRQGRRRRKLLDGLKERRGYSHLKEEALDRTMWRARFGRGFGPVVRQTTKWMSLHCSSSKSISNIAAAWRWRQNVRLMHRQGVTFHSNSNVQRHCHQKLKYNKRWVNATTHTNFLNRPPNYLSNSISYLVYKR